VALAFDDAVTKIAGALGLPHEVAMALMCGLCATGQVTCANKEAGKKLRLIDPDKEPMGDAARPLFISAKDFDYWMRDHSRTSSSDASAVV
jgi:hypothetical protein